MQLITNTFRTISKRGLSIAIKAVLNHLVGWINQLFGKRFYEKKIYNYRMVLDLYDRGISRTLLLFGSREKEHKIMLEKYLRPGMTVLDIGANIGYYALMELSLIGEKGTLIAVEPSPSNIRNLRKNIELNGYENIEIHQAAISEKAGVKKFFLSEMSNLNTFHDTGTGSLHLSGETVDVQAKTVGEIMQGRNLDLMRMDVEGHEVEVINGLLPQIERGELSPAIIFETHLSRYGADHDIEAPLKRLFAQGYKVRFVGSSSRRGSNQLESLGYRGGDILKTDGDERKIFENIDERHALDLISRQGGIRTVLLTRSPE